MSIKLIVTDMDGSFLNDDHATISPRNIAAFRAASARGVKLAFASGRTWSLLSEAAEQVGVLDYAILSNGAVVMDAHTGRRFYEHCIPNEQACQAIDYLQGQGISFEIHVEGQTYVREYGGLPEWETRMPSLFAVYSHGALVAPDLRTALKDYDLEKMDLYITPELRNRIYPQLSSMIPIGASSSGAPNGTEYNREGASKGRALRILAEHLGLQPEEIMAFGDGENDADMLSWAGWSFAMGNGTEAAKAAARYIAPANEEGGVGQMIEKYVLEQE